MIAMLSLMKKLSAKTMHKGHSLHRGRFHHNLRRRLKFNGILRRRTTFRIFQRRFGLRF